MKPTISQMRDAAQSRLVWVQKKLESDSRNSYFYVERSMLEHVLAGGSLDPEGATRAKVAAALRLAHSILVRLADPVQYSDSLRAIESSLNGLAEGH